MIKSVDRASAAILLAVALAATASGRQGPATAPPLFLDDFERAGLAARWQAAGPIRAARQPVADDAARIEGVGGAALRVVAGPGARLRTAPLPGRPDLARCERAVLRVCAEGASPESPVTFELHFYAADRRAWRWRKVTLDREGWQQLALPLAYFRPGGGTSPSWEEVDRLGFYFRDDTQLLLDGLELRAGASEDAADLALDRLRDDAFGPDAVVRILRRDPFVVLTDSADVPEGPLLDALDAMYRRTREDLPVLPTPTRPVRLLIFADEAGYRAFWPRFARRFAAEMGPPSSGGFTALGIASGSCRATDPGALRPVYVHEASHALMTQMLGIASEGNWLFEALGVRYQLDVSGQDLRPIVRRALADPAMRPSLGELLDGRRSPRPATGRPPRPSNGCWSTRRGGPGSTGR